MSSFDRLKTDYPWLKKPLVANAPMRPFARPELAAEVSKAGGFGFTGYYPNASEVLKHAKEILPPLENGTIPIGIGFLLFYDGDMQSAVSSIIDNPPAAAWLFAPGGPQDLKKWSDAIREASKGRTKIWVQVGSVKDALDAVEQCGKDVVLVGQSSDAGGHGLVMSSGLVTLIPGIIDALAKAGHGNEIPVLATGGISEARGAAAVLVLGASGVVLGTRFLASHEAEAPPGFTDAIFAAKDGGQETIRSRFYDNLINVDWPPEYDARNLINQSYMDDKAGVPLEEIQRNYQKERGEINVHGYGAEGHLATYVGAGVGLISEVKGAGAIVEEIRTGIIKVATDVQSIL